ncbi:hypothetical protein WME88_27670 [Sorangium sp. So ce216]
MSALEDLDERAMAALSDAWASRRPGRARRVLLVARAAEGIAADVARLPEARVAGDVVVAVVSAEAAARMLDVMFWWRGDDVREADQGETAWPEGARPQRSVKASEDGARRSEMNMRTSKRKRGNGQYGCTTKVSAADVESEFMPQMVLPDRDITVAQVVREAGFLPQLAAAPAPDLAAELLPPTRRRGVVEARPQ